MHPQHFSTGQMSGRVIEAETRAPLSNVLVVAELWVEFEDGMSGQIAPPKRIASDYSITGTNGEFGIRSLDTTYLHFGTFMRSRDARGGIVGAYHPLYEVRSKGVENGLTLFEMSPRTNETEFASVLRYFSTGRKHLHLRKTDKEHFEELYGKYMDTNVRKNLK